MSAVRTVLAVALATALLASALPVVEDARTNRTEARLETTVERVERVAHTLVAAEDPVVSGRPASRIVTVTLPSGSVSDAPVRYLAFGGPPGATTTATNRTPTPTDTTTATNRTLTPTDATTAATRTPSLTDATTATANETLASPSSSDAVYRVGERPPKRVELSVRLLVAEPVVLGPGRNRLRLSLVRTADGVGVRIRPLSAAG